MVKNELYFVGIERGQARTVVKFVRNQGGKRYCPTPASALRLERHFNARRANLRVMLAPHGLYVTLYVQ